MEDRAGTDINHFFSNQRIQEALSGLGVFAIDYGQGRSFASSIWKTCGYTAQDMDDRLFLELIHPDHRADVNGALEDLTRGRIDRWEGVFRMLRKDGTWVWIAATYAVVYRDAEGLPQLYLGHDRDVTEIKEKEEELRQRLAEIETLRQVIAEVNTSLDLTETVGLILDQTRKVIPYQRCTVQFIDGPELKVIGCTGFADRDSILAVRFPYPDSHNPGSQALQSRIPLICNDIAAGFPGFRQVPGEEPTRSWLGIPLIANNEVIGLLALDSVEPGFYTTRHLELAEVFAGHVALAVDKARLYENLQDRALTDELTGAGNRHSLQIQGPFFLEKARREQRPLLALMVDLDGFKQVNDLWGHDVGDTLLKQTAHAIRSCLRSYDLFFRYGGEEFLILLPDATAATAYEVAERIRQSVQTSEPVGQTAPPTVSVGLGSLVPSATTALSDLIKVADLALYEAKEAGKNRTKVREA